MLSQEEQRRLDEIERHLEQSDPKLATQLQSGRPRRRLPILILAATMMVLIIAMLGVVVGWLAATIGAVVELSAATAFAIVRPASGL
jgi:Protein of unknown function (DUF3040)